MFTTRPSSTDPFTGDDRPPSATAGAPAPPYVYYDWYMSLRRTNVYADAADLVIIKEAAARRGISEAEIIREGIHLAAMSSRVWDDPLNWPTFEGPGTPAIGGEVTRTIAERLSDQ